MENLIIEQDVSSKQKYEKPNFDIIKISSVDIIAGPSGDGNQAPWDPLLASELTVN